MIRHKIENSSQCLFIVYEIDEFWQCPKKLSANSEADFHNIFYVFATSDLIYHINNDCGSCMATAVSETKYFEK